MYSVSVPDISGAGLWLPALCSVRLLKANMTDRIQLIYCTFLEIYIEFKPRVSMLTNDLFVLITHTIAMATHSIDHAHSVGAQCQSAE